MIQDGKIKGVKFKKLTRFSDDRGWFEEVVRDDENLVKKFGQISASKTNPGVIKAFHYHEKQDDLWFFPKGNARVVLHDLREDSATKGTTEQYFMGEDNPGLLLIPKGVAHGYQVLGQEPVIITYLTTEPYDPKNPDEKRLDWNDKTINFNWEIENK